MIDSKDVRKEAEQRTEENLMFRRFLKLNADEKELDKQFKRLHQEIFPQYDCTKCRNCCREYEIEIPEKDLERDAKKLGMTKDLMISTFLKRDAKSGKYTVRGDTCAFLEADGNCLLDNCRPLTCKEYPHTDQPGRMGSLFEVVRSAEICPVVFEIYERLKEEYGFLDPATMSESGRKSILKSAKDFVEFYGLDPLSAVGMECLHYKVPELQNAVNKKSMEIFVQSEEEKTVSQNIEEAKTKDEFFKLMRKPMVGCNRTELRKKLIENEGKLLEFFKEKALRNTQDIFIENALYFFLHAKTDCCDWILSEYENIRSEYMKSMLCLVLGVRGEITVMPFLQEEAMRFMTSVDESEGSLEQGPLYGMHELIGRMEKN